MRRLVRVLHPILFAISLVVGIAARGAGQYRAWDLALVTAVVALATALCLAIVYAVVRLVVTTDRAAPLAAAIAMLLVAWFFYYGPAQRAAQAITWRASRDQVLIPLGLLATMAALWWILRQSRERLDVVNTFMARFGALLLAFVVAQLLFSQRDTPTVARRSELVRQLAVPLRISSVPAERNTPKRDIYLFVLDGHPNARVSREVLQYDDSSFTDSLRALGFTIPRDMHSNYAQTILSMPSLLNASLLTLLTKDAGANNPSYALPAYLIENNRSARFLRSQGYKYVLFPSMWFTQSQHSPISDMEFDPRPLRSLANELRRTELRQVVLNATLLRFRSQPPLDPRHELETMEGLQRMPADSAPTFVFAHILLPHMPYYLDASCHPLAQPIQPEQEDGESPEQRAAHIAQMRCVDGMVLGVVRTLLRDSPTPPIILIVGDHGTRFTFPHFSEQPDRLPVEFMRERFGPLGAFYLPAGGDSAFTGSVSLVNVMGNVLRYYFGADIPQSADDMYVSGTYAYRFLKVDSTGYVRR